MEWVLIVSALATGGHPGAEETYVEITKLGFEDFTVCLKTKDIFLTANESIKVYGLEVNCEEVRASES